MYRIIANTCSLHKDISYHSSFLENLSDYETHTGIKMLLSYDVASGSEITLCNEICKALVVYRFTGNVMTSITTLCT